MTPEQLKHAEQLSGLFHDLMLAKYEKGAIEHRSNLWEATPEQLIDFAIDEAIDEATYLLTLKQQLHHDV